MKYNKKSHFLVGEMGGYDDVSSRRNTGANTAAGKVISE